MESRIAFSDFFQRIFPIPYYTGLHNARDGVSSSMQVCTTPETVFLGPCKFVQRKRRRLLGCAGLYNARDAVSCVMRVCMELETPSLVLCKFAQVIVSSLRGSGRRTHCPRGRRSPRTCRRGAIRAGRRPSCGCTGVSTRRRRLRIVRFCASTKAHSLRRASSRN